MQDELIGLFIDFKIAEERQAFMEEFEVRTDTVPPMEAISCVAKREELPNIIAWLAYGANCDGEIKGVDVIDGTLEYTLTIR